jgi:hypothetical protein
VLVIRNRFMPYFVRAAGLALLAATLTACGLLTDVSPPNLAVTVEETESGFLVRATARDGDSGIKSIEVASAVGEDVTTLHAEDFARAEEGEYPREITVEATAPLSASEVMVQVRNGFGVATEQLREVAPAAEAPSAWAPTLLYLTPRITAPDGLLMLLFDAGTTDALLEVSVRVQGELVSADDVVQLEDPRQWQMTLPANGFGFDLAAEEELLVNVTLTWGEMTRSLTQTVFVELDTTLVY